MKLIYDKFLNANEDLPRGFKNSILSSSFWVEINLEKSPLALNSSRTIRKQSLVIK
jgi:hypothetical protein